MIPESIAVIGESGIRQAEDVAMMSELNIDAILVGESLVRSKDTLQKTSELIRAGELK